VKIGDRFEGWMRRGGHFPLIILITIVTQINNSVLVLRKTLIMGDGETKVNSKFRIGKKVLQ